MQSRRIAGIGLVCFLLGLAAQAGLAQNQRPTYTPELVKGKEPAAAATALLDGALQLAGNGSWERIAVGRAWYLGGDKARGEQIMHEVTSSNKAKGSDWFRVGRVYAEAGEWDKAKPAFQKALEMNKGDDNGMIEFGGLANVNNDRATAESLFDEAFKKSPREFWHWVNAGGSYLGVKPQ